VEVERGGSSDEDERAAEDIFNGIISSAKNINPGLGVLHSPIAIGISSLLAEQMLLGAPSVAFA